MVCFDFNGILYIIVEGNMALVGVKHSVQHTPYMDISLPTGIKTLIEGMHRNTVPEVNAHITFKYRELTWTNRLVNNPKEISFSYFQVPIHMALLGS